MTSEKCLGKGSTAPGPVPKDLIRLYSMRFCPFAQRTRLVLHAKGIKHDVININLKNKPDWFLEKNPLGLVPVLETHSGQVIYESPITCEYLDDMYPQKKLLPSDPFEKAQQRMFLENFSKVTPFFYKIPMGRKKGEDVSELEADFKDKLSHLNKLLGNKKFFGGNSLTMIDYMMWPWFERMDMLDLKHCMDGFPGLENWTKHMLEDPSVKAIMFSTETYKAFYKTYMEGTPDYDYGL